MTYNPKDLLAKASALIDERGATYGGIENNFQRIADLVSIRLGGEYHPFEIAVVMCCVKAARLIDNPAHLDSRLDLMNYEAFAALFADDYAARLAPEPAQALNQFEQTLRAHIERDSQ